MQYMKTHFLDTSALVKLFLKEDGSEAIHSNFGKASVNWTTSLCIAELLGVFKCKYVRKDISKEKYLELSDELIGSVRNESIKIEQVDISDFYTFQDTENLCKKYEIDLADSLQIITLLQGFPSKLEGESKPLFITADSSLAKAARDQGLKVWECINEQYPS